MAGSSESYSISVVTREGATTLSANKDGTQSMLQVPLEETLALWRTLLDAGLESLGDASPESPAPDGSEFIVRFRAGEACGGLTAPGVPSAAGTRYRRRARRIP